VCDIQLDNSYIIGNILKGKKKM